MRKILALLLILLTTSCYADPSGPGPVTRWLEVDGSPDYRPRTIVVSNDIISIDASGYMSLDIVGRVSADNTYVRRDGTTALTNNWNAGSFIIETRALSADAISTDSVRLYDSGYHTVLNPPTLTADVTYILPLADGSSNDFLQTDGAGNLIWKPVPPTLPAGADTQVQYNNSGAFGADAGFTTNKAGSITLTGTVQAEQLTSTDDIMANGGISTIPSAGDNACLAVVGDTNPYTGSASTANVMRVDRTFSSPEQPTQNRYGQVMDLVTTTVIASDFGPGGANTTTTGTYSIVTNNANHTADMLLLSMCLLSGGR